MFVASSALRSALETAVAGVLGVPVSSVEGLHVIARRRQVESSSSYMVKSLLSSSSLSTDLSGKFLESAGDHDDEVTVGFDVTSEYDAPNTEEALIASREELMSEFVRAAQYNNYTGSIQTLQNVDLVGVSSASLAPTPSPIESPTPFPSSLPSMRPTVLPSLYPTDGPTQSPTTSPSQLPTFAPTPLPSSVSLLTSTVSITLENLPAKALIDSYTLQEALCGAIGSVLGVESELDVRYSASTAYADDGVYICYCRFLRNVKI